MVPSAGGELSLEVRPERDAAERRRFLVVFAVLVSFMGTRVGMAQVSASLYAVSLGASETMLGLIAGSQSVLGNLVGAGLGHFISLPSVFSSVAAGFGVAGVWLWLRGEGSRRSAVVQ